MSIYIFPNRSTPFFIARESAQLKSCLLYKAQSSIVHSKLACFKMAPLTAKRNFILLYKHTNVLCVYIYILCVDFTERIKKKMYWNRTFTCPRLMKRYSVTVTQPIPRALLLNSTSAHETLRTNVNYPYI